MLAYFSSFLFMELISLKIKKFRTNVSRQHPIWPAAITKTNPTNIRMVHLVLSKKFLLIFSPKWVISTGAGGFCFLVSSASENSVEVGSYI